jgi:hypothetical protein
MLDGESGGLTLILDRLLGSEELVLVLLGAAGGVTWGLLALVFGMSLHLTHMSGAVQVLITIFSLPLYLAWWLGATLQLSLVDPSGLVLAAGATLGVLLIVTWLSIERSRGRWESQAPAASSQALSGAGLPARRPVNPGTPRE